MSPRPTLVLPDRFIAGMAFVDTTDSVPMVGHHDWTLAQPLRELWYNLTITAASVAVALRIGGIRVSLWLIADQFGLKGGIWPVVTDLNNDLASFGLAVFGVFILAWGLAAIVYRSKGYDLVAAMVA